MAAYRSARIGTIQLGFIAFCAVLLISYLEFAKGRTEDVLSREKLTAAQTMLSAMAAIREERVRLGFAIDPAIDVNETGIIGSDYTDLTTTLGSLSSKRTSTNPNFAGAIVDMLHSAGVKSGDAVAVSFSGSFPALNIAVLSAIQALALRPVIISSVGASMYGANEPHLTWLDMERVLRERKIFPYTSSAAALGGIVETEGGLDRTGIESGLEAIERSHAPYLEEHGEKTVEKDIENRMAVYDRALGGLRPNAFINVGGSIASLGLCPQAANIAPGFVRRMQSCNSPKRGIIYRMAEQGVPIIHLLNIKRIARTYGLPIDPVPLPKVPDGSVMKAHSYSAAWALSAFGVLCTLIILLGNSKH